jgi:radical SAM protein with 4Fe4S-binding SPASM domain
MYPGWDSVAQWLGERQVPVRIVSNGTLVSDMVARRCAELEITSVQVTLNGPDSEMHDAHAGRACFDGVLRGVSALSTEGVEVIGCIVVTRHNAATVSRILELWHALGVGTVALSRFSPVGLQVVQSQRWLPRREDLERAFTEAAAFARTGTRIHSTMPVPACMFDTSRFAPIEFGCCAIGTPAHELALGPDGALRLCPLHGAPLGGPHDVVDPRVDLEERLGAPELRAYRSQLPEFCRDCSEAPRCGGGCGAASGHSLPAEVTREGAKGSRRLDPLLAQYIEPGEEVAPGLLERSAPRGRFPPSP